MTPTRQLRDRIPKDPMDHGPVAVPSDAVRAVTGQPDDRRLSVVANAIGYEMLRHDGRPVTAGSAEVEQIDVDDAEAARCRAAAARVLDHLANLDDTRAFGHPELNAMAAVAAALDPLPPDGQRRVLDWVDDRFHVGSVTTLHGRVLDAGGGEVRIALTRDTTHYPDVGSTVHLDTPTPTRPDPNVTETTR